nr:hypothetical protein [Pseudomonas syringae]
MKGNDPIAQILERARQRIEQLAIAGDREVMFHIAAEAQGWIALCRQRICWVKNNAKCFTQN